MRLAALLFLFLAFCSEPAFADQAADDGTLFTVTGKDLLSLLIAVIAPVGGIGIWMGKLLLKLSDNVRDLAPAVAALAKEQEKCEKERRELRQEIRRVEDVASDKRGEIYRHFEGKLSATPAAGFPPAGGQK